MADTITGNTQLGTTKQSLIASLVQKELAFNAKLMPFVTDVSMFAVDGMKQISFPKLTSFTVVNRTEGVAGDATALTSSVDDLLLDQNAYVAWVIDAMTIKQANIPAQLEFAKRAAAAQARYVDTQIIAKLRSVASHFQNVGADVNITYANVLDMVKRLEEADANMADAVFLISPAQKAAMMALDEFKRADVYGQATIKSGVIGEILGVPVVVHNGLVAKEAFLMEKSAIAVGFQKSASYGEQSALEYGVGAVKAAVDQLFGLCGLQLAQKGAAAGKSPLVLGLND